MLASLCMVLAVGGGIADFCPLSPGIKRTYEDANGVQTVDEVLESMQVGKSTSAIPVKSTVAGHSAGTVLYRIDGDTLQLLGYRGPGKNGAEENNLLKEAQPILRVGPARTDWQYVSEIPTGLGPVLLQVKGNAAPGPKRSILGRDAETIVAHVQSRIGNDRNPIEVKQDVVYAKGIGMIEMAETTKAQGQTVKKLLKLVKFETPLGNW